MEEIGQGAGIRCLHPLPIQVRECLSPFTDDDRIRCTEQVFELWFGKVQMQQCDKRDKNPG